MLFNEICIEYNKNVNKDDTILANKKRIVAVDGVHNNNKNRDELLNLGIFAVSNNIPINVQCFGEKNKGQEVKIFMEYIKSNLAEFKNVIFVADRLYFNYNLLDFLCENNLKFIIRAKGEALNLNPKKYT